MYKNLFEIIINAVAMLFIIMILNIIIKSRIASTTTFESFTDKKTRYGDNSLYTNLLAYVDETSPSPASTAEQGTGSESMLQEEAFVDGEDDDTDETDDAVASLIPFSELEQYVPFTG